MLHISAFHNLNPGKFKAVKRPEKLHHDARKRIQNNLQTQRTLERKMRLQKIAEIKRECDDFRAQYLENKRQAYCLPNTPLIQWMIAHMRPLKLRVDGRTRIIWMQLYMPCKHYPSTYYENAEIQKKDFWS